MKKPDVIALFKLPGDRPYSWHRRTATGQVTARSEQSYSHKAAMWRNARVRNPDWETCRIADETGTAATEDGPGDYSRPPGQRTPRPLPSIEVARRRL